MAPRAYWSGNVRISLVTLPVRLYTATESAKELIKAKIEEREPPEAEEREYAENVIDLMDALKRSVAGSKGAGASGSSKAKTKSSSRKSGGKTKSARGGRSGERKRKSA